MGVKLGKFIKNLEEYNKAPTNTLITKDTVIELIYAVLWQISKYTIVDTLQARSLVIYEFARAFGFEYEDLNDQIYRYWEKHGYPENKLRHWGTEVYFAKSKFVAIKTAKEYKFTLSVKDNGFYNQAMGDPRYPSPAVETDDHIPRDNSQFIPRHVDYVIDAFNSADYSSFEKLNMREIVSNIKKNVEKQLFK